MVPALHNTRVRMCASVFSRKNVYAYCRLCSGTRIFVPGYIPYSIGRAGNFRQLSPVGVQTLRQNKNVDRRTTEHRTNSSDAPKTLYTSTRSNYRFTRLSAFQTIRLSFKLNTCIASTISFVDLKTSHQKRL